MSAGYKPETIETLRCIASGVATFRLLHDALPHIRELGRVLKNLQSHGHIERENRGDKNLGALYSMTSKGKRLLERFARSQMGEVPLPRSFVTEGTYTPKPIPVRPGSQDFLDCGSVENGQHVERKRPLILGVRVA